MGLFDYFSKQNRLLRKYRNLDSSMGLIKHHISLYFLTEKLGYQCTFIDMKDDDILCKVANKDIFIKRNLESHVIRFLLSKLLYLLDSDELVIKLKFTGYSLKDEASIFAYNLLLNDDQILSYIANEVLNNNINPAIIARDFMVSRDLVVKKLKDLNVNYRNI